MLATGVADDDDHNANLPDTPELLQNWPNPFNPTTFITFSIPRDLANRQVTLTVHNARGQLVQRLLQAPMPAGQFTVKWNGLQSDGQRVSSGVYFYTLKVADFKSTGRMTLLR